MIKITPAADRYQADHGWLQANWHFSFGDYYDPANVSWSKLRVFNDDTILGGGGFGMHPHRDMEIITYMIDGTLRHTDSLGHTGVLRPGEVQVMSAGSGICHAEANDSATEPLRLTQIWIEPRTRVAKPRWDQKSFSVEQRRNRLLPIVSAGEIDGTLPIDQDATIYVSSLENGNSLSHAGSPGRHAYLFVINGALTLNGSAMHTGDQARIRDEAGLDIHATENTELILLDLP